MTLDYTIDSPEERKKIVEQILDEVSDPSELYLEALANYLIMSMEKEERKQRKILTENRLSTVNKREMSFEGLSMQFENGEDGIYGLITNDKNVIFKPKQKITKKDLETIPYLRQLREGIDSWEEALPKAAGKSKYIMKKALIEMRKEQYIIKNSYLKPIETNKISYSTFSPVLDEKIEPEPFEVSGVSLLDPFVVSNLLCNYNKLKDGAEIRSDTWCIMQDLDKLIEKALESQPKLKKILEYKIDNYQNIEIQEKIFNEFKIQHSLEYFSTVWRNKIPKLIADVAKAEYLEWHYTNEEKGKFKRCSRCGMSKLASPDYFPRNKASKDGLYSICKECRKKKRAAGQK